MIAWRQRSTREGLTGPADRPHPGRAQTVRRVRHAEILAFLQQVAKTYPRRRLHVICDNYATHKHHKVQAWLLGHSRVQLHSTPTCASWLNLVEVFFSIVERQVPCRGDFASVADLAAAIGRFISAWNQRCQPFTWTKDANTILDRLNRNRTAATIRSASASLSP